jgi:hypothetical protein
VARPPAFGILGTVVPDLHLSAAPQRALRSGGSLRPSIVALRRELDRRIASAEQSAKAPRRKLGADPP